MAFIKEESEDMKIEEILIVKLEDPEEQTDLMSLKEESEELNEMENQNEKHDFMTGEKSTKTEKTSRKRAQKTDSNSYFTCFHVERASLKTKTLKPT
ncbi:gastrula zinc finger protein XlCGF8.2DB-like [Pimephales promelas]|nr:gastrula zinc finger protein XlCGF8.2DB-like [Pimephales promelas]